jgi:Zn-dependent M28 family amino/carboxypeptidase
MHMNDSPRPIFNVIATIEGSEQPDRWVILGAHHDAWSSGGVDPGQPVAALLELARVLGAMSKGGWRPRHSIQLAFWDGGEYGNVGAAQHAQEFSRDLEEKLLAYVNCDLTAAGPTPVEGDFPPPPGMEMAFGARHSIYDTAA